MQKIKAVYLKAGSSEAPTVITIGKENLDEYYKLLNCDTIDIVYRQFGNKVFSIIIDDEGRLKESPIVSIFRKPSYIPDIVGSVLICGHVDLEGNLTSLSKEDQDIILSNVISYAGYGVGRRFAFVID